MSTLSPFGFPQPGEDSASNIMFNQVHCAEEAAGAGVSLPGSSGPSLAALLASISALDPISFNEQAGVISHMTKQGLVPGVYGSATSYPVVTVDAFGHIASATEQTATPATPYTLPALLASLNQITTQGQLTRTATGWTTKVLSGSPRVTVVSTISTDVIDLVAVNTAPVSAGSATKVPVLAVDIYGRVTVTGEAALPALPTVIPQKGLAALVDEEAGTPAEDGMNLVYSNGNWEPTHLARGPFAQDSNNFDDALFTYIGNLRIGGAGPTVYKLQVEGSGRFSGDVIAFSDRRVKDNIHTISGALDKVLALRGVTYTRTDGDSTEKIGLIAQEVQEVIPQVVHADAEGMLGVSYGNIVALLIEAIREQQVLITNLKCCTCSRTTAK